MPHTVNDPAPGAAGQPLEQSATGGSLSDAQFAQLVELLTPGYECSKLMLADYHRQQDQRAEAEQAAKDRMDREREADEKAQRDADAKKAADDAAAKAAAETPKG